MSWKTLQVNNATQEYRLIHDSGRKVQINVPNEHRGKISSEVFVKAACDGHEYAISNPTRNKKRDAALVGATFAICVVIHFVIVVFHIK